MTIPPCPCGAPEQWRAIPGWEGLYEVSDHGQVRSLDRMIPSSRGGRQRLRGRLLKPAYGTDGRRFIGLHRDGQSIQRRIYTLVLEAFVGPRPDGFDACHNDGDCVNDHVGNLRWATRSDNILDAVRHGTHVATRRTHCNYGHPMTGPNLAQGAGRRLCKACMRARRTRDRDGMEAFQREADEHYARIVAGERLSLWANRARSRTS
jgi:hypothetical protein